MPDSANSKVQATVWVTPEQVDRLRTAAYEIGAEYLQQRNETVIQFAYDTGLRVGELVAVDINHLRESNQELYVPAGIQKDYPNDNTPDPVTMELASETARVVSSYLSGRWKESPALFPSRSSDRMTTQSVRNMLKKVAEQAGVRPYLIDGGRGDPSDLTPHALRHGVAYRMMNKEKGNSLYDVRNRLRHRSIQTTERVYDHLNKV